MESKLLELYKETLLDHVFRLHADNDLNNTLFMVKMTHEMLRVIDNYVVEAKSLEELLQCEKMLKLLEGSING